MKYPDIDIPIKYPNKLINADTPAVPAFLHAVPVYSLMKSSSIPRHQTNWQKKHGRAPGTVT